MYRGNKKTGFTLVEILIVVIILGILAAIVIPQFTNASTEARWSATSSLLQTLRSQIELFKLQHSDTLPDLESGSVGAANGGTAGMWNDFTVGHTFNLKPVGPYMQQPPKNPMTGLNTVEDGQSGGAPSATAGFMYDWNGGTGTGRIWATDKDTPSAAAPNRIFNEDQPNAPLANIP
jgi:general secretion pathway protein G